MSIHENNDKYTLYTFLEEHLVEKGKTYTHTSMGKPLGSYFIKNSELPLFYELLCKALFNNIDLSLTEKHEDFGPMLIDLDFRFEVDILTRMHNETHIKKFVNLYIQEICEVFNIEKDDPKLVAFVFERDGPYQDKSMTKDGIHIMFPFIVSYPNAQYHIRDNILKKIGDIFEEIPNLKNKNKIADIVDRSVIYTNNWLLFGCKKPNLEAYKISYIFNGLLDNIPVDEYNFSDTNLPRFFSIRNKKDSDLTPIRESKKELLETMNVKKKNIKKISSHINYDIEQIKAIVSILSTDRAESYNSWIEVGWTLHNIDCNSQELLNIWIEFSQKSSKFKEGICEKEWEKSKSEGLNIGSLHFWAKNDSPEKYKAIMEEDINRDIEKTTKTPTNYVIASVLYKMFKYDFKYSCSEWYMYKNHVWHKETDGMSLRTKISNDLCDKYIHLISSFNIASKKDITEEEREEYKKRGKELLDIVKNLGNTPFKENIMKECKELFSDKEFSNKLDNNPYLIGFNNGVYDLQKQELREGRPDDYIEMNTGIDKISFDENHEHWPDLKQFIDTVFYEEDTREYFLTYLASCIQGHNAEEKFRIWTGVGSNGKSKILELFVHSMGMYAIKFPITMLTGKRAASNACTPEIVQSKGKRFGYFEEPSEDEKINAGLLKEFTGGDKIKARGLHKEPIEFKPQFKLALLCNEMPKVPPHDTGTWRRLEVIEFKSRFCENPKEPNEFPIDKQLSEKLKNWRELFMALLIDVYYVEYKKNGIKVPYDVEKFTQEFRKQCDLYDEFVYDNLDDTKNPSDVISINDIYEEFKLWHDDAYNNHKCPSKNEFKKYLSKRYTSKRVSTKDIRGFRFKTKDENEGHNSDFDGEEIFLQKSLSNGDLKKGVILFQNDSEKLKSALSPENLNNGY